MDKSEVMLLLLLFALCTTVAVEDQCEEGKIPSNTNQAFENPVVEGRTLDDCKELVRQNQPNAKAVYHTLQGDCTAYIDYNSVYEDGGVLGSNLCTLADPVTTNEELAGWIELIL